MTDILQDHELGWDDEIQKESDFILLPEGDYDFTVKSFERGRHNGSEKLPPCNKASITLTIHSPEHGDVDIFHNIFLHTKTEGMISAFFIGIGQKKKGEKLKMNWNAVVGAKGRAKIGLNTYRNQKGEERTNNQVVKFYESDSHQTDTFTPGQF